MEKINSWDSDGIRLYFYDINKKLIGSLDIFTGTIYEMSIREIENFIDSFNRIVECIERGKE